MAVSIVFAVVARIVGIIAGRRCETAGLEALEALPNARPEAMIALSFVMSILVGLVFILVGNFRSGLAPDFCPVSNGGETLARR